MTNVIEYAQRRPSQMTQQYGSALKEETFLVECHISPRHQDLIWLILHLVKFGETGVTLGKDLSLRETYQNHLIPKIQPQLHLELSKLDHVQELLHNLLIDSRINGERMWNNINNTSCGIYH